MLQKLKQDYQLFHDAIITEICYKCAGLNYTENRDLYITVNCINVNNNNSFEKIRIYFRDVFEFRFKETNQSSFVINSILILEENKFIVFDFFADIIEDWTLKENPDSDFIIKCKKLTYEVLSSETDGSII